MLGTARLGVPSKGAQHKKEPGSGQRDVSNLGRETEGTRHAGFWKKSTLWPQKEQGILRKLQNQAAKSSKHNSAASPARLRGGQGAGSARRGTGCPVWVPGLGGRGWPLCRSSAWRQRAPNDAEIPAVFSKGRRRPAGGMDPEAFSSGLPVPHAAVAGLGFLFNKIPQELRFCPEKMYDFDG